MSPILCSGILITDTKLFSVFTVINQCAYLPKPHPAGMLHIAYGMYEKMNYMLVQSDRVDQNKHMRRIVKFTDGNDQRKPNSGVGFNSFGAKLCFPLNKLSTGKKFICKVENKSQKGLHCGNKEHTKIKKIGDSV